MSNVPARPNPITSGQKVAIGIGLAGGVAAAVYYATRPAAAAPAGGTTQGLGWTRPKPSPVPPKHGPIYFPNPNPGLTWLFVGMIRNNVYLPIYGRPQPASVPALMNWFQLDSGTGQPFYVEQPAPTTAGAVGAVAVGANVYCVDNEDNVWVLQLPPSNAGAWQSVPLYQWDRSWPGQNKIQLPAPNNASLQVTYVTAAGGLWLWLAWASDFSGLPGGAVLLSDAVPTAVQGSIS